MYLIALIVGILMILLLLLSGREDALKGSLKLPKAFMRMAGYVYRQTHKLPKHLPESKMVRRCLTQLYPGEAWADLHKAFYTEKIALCLAILAAATLLGVVLKAQSTASVTLQSGNMFYRDEYDKGDRSVTLAARVEDQYQGTWAVNVNSRSLDRDEANETVAVFWEQVCNRIFANQSKEGEVRTDIDLLRELPSYPFTIEWKSSKPDILDANGKIGRVTNSEEILLTAQIRYEQNAEPVLAAEEWMDSDTDIQEASFTWEYQLPIIVLPIEQSEEAKIRNELGKMLQETHTKTASEKEWVLPTDWDGQDIIWEEVPDDSSIVFFAIGLTVTILVFFLMNKDLQGKTQKRSGKMLDDYPLLINKLVLYLGAGMTIRGAWFKVSEKYRSSPKTNTARPAYEEMVYTEREMITGVSEVIAYERFGRRSGLPAFVKLANLLTQNIRKGNQTLLLRMKEEAWSAMEERLYRRKKLGEEAATKLLLPMMMMLGIVMVLIMIPAFSALGG